MDDPSPEDPLPGIRANLDQMIAMAPELARVAKAWYDTFTEQGFTDNQALYLTAVQLKNTPGTLPG